MSVFSHQNKSSYLIHGLDQPQPSVLCAFPSIPPNHASLHIQCHLHSQIINTVVLTHALLSASSAQQTFLLHGHWQMASHLSKFRAHVTFPRNTFLTHPKMNCSFSPLQPSRFLLCHLQHFVAFICHCVSLLSYQTVSFRE